MDEQQVKKLRQLARQQEKKELDDEMKIIPYLFRPRPRIIPKFVWKLLFYTVVKKEMLKYVE